MSILRIKLEDGILKEHYQHGMQRLLELPISYYEDSSNKIPNGFFAYLTTLGGGLVGGDDYFQSFDIKNTTAIFSSQSNQKTFKGKSRLISRINLDENSKLIFFNDANIFYENADFMSTTKIFCKKDSKFFYLDGGYTGYANNNFKADIKLKIYENSKLVLNDVFDYQNISNLNSLFKHKFFYTLVIKDSPLITSIMNDNLKAFSTGIDEITIVRVAGDDNDLAKKYINEIQHNFLKEVK